MPFLDHDGGRVYFRHWAADDPRAAVIFLHGFGEHTEFDGARHDVLNESVHREVAAAIVDFVGDQAQNRT